MNPIVRLRLFSGKIILLLNCLLSVPLYGQPVTLARYTAQHESPGQPAKYRPLSDVLQELEIHYRVAFVYESGLTVGKVVDNQYRLHKGKLENTLHNILKPLGLQFTKVGDCSYVLSPIKLKNSAPVSIPDAQADSRKPIDFPSVATARSLSSVAMLPVSVDFAITGRVTSENGESLPGVNVVIKGTIRGTSTDTEGMFQLNVPNENTTLVFSFVGYASQEVPVGNRTTLTVQLLPDNKSLNAGTGSGIARPSAALFNLYSDKDTRKAVTFITSYVYNGITTTLSSTDPDFTKAVSFQKLWDKTAKTASGEGTSIPILRYSDVLLMYAEATNEAANGPTADAYAALNKVRVRAGLSPLSGLTYQSFKEAVWLERRLELTFENVRRYDLIRTGRLLDAVKAENSFARNATIQPFHVLLPIPQADMDANPNLKQNTGY